MADDRHGAYRMIHEVSALNVLFKKFSKKYSIGIIAHTLLSMQAAYPNDTLETVIELTKDELNG
jgi:hypothetical protein